MQNLIENAVKYGNGGYLGIKSEDEENCRLITVCNSGEGPGDGEMLHIFDSFYRGSNSSNVNGSRYGIIYMQENTSYDGWRNICGK